MRRSILGIALLAVFGLVALPAADPERDFSGKWVLDPAASNTRPLGLVDETFEIAQSEAGILVTAPSGKWSFALDGSETRKKINGEERSSLTKWEGSALLINTLVSGQQNYTIMDRWKLSRNRDTLNVTRQIVRAGHEVEATLVYNREGAGPKLQTQTESIPAPQPAPPSNVMRPTLSRRAEATGGDVIVPSGTHVLLELVGEITTKRAKDGDNVYLRTASPISVNGRVVIPRGADVQGTITHVKPAGKVAGKGQLFIRFDSLTLQNGTTRDFRARPSRDEGKVEGDTKAADGQTVLLGTGIGAGIGHAAGGLGGMAVGGVGGALAGVLLSRQQDVVLHPGTHIEMVLDRDLVFKPEELM